MFEIVKAIHDALRTDSTWAFVISIGIVFGILGSSMAWIVDKGYSNSLKEGSAQIGQSSVSHKQQPSPGTFTHDGVETVFKRDFETASNIWMRVPKQFVTMTDGEQQIPVGIQANLIINRDTNISMLVFLVDRSPAEVDVCISLAAKSREWAARISHGSSVVGIRFDDGKPHYRLSQSTFSNKVFIYPNDDLSFSDKARLERAFDRNGLKLEFRGFDNV